MKLDLTRDDLPIRKGKNILETKLTKTVILVKGPFLFKMTFKSLYMK